MLALAPPELRADPAAGVMLTALLGRRFGVGSDRLDDPASSQYLPALGRQTHIEFRPDIMAGTGNNFVRMCSAVTIDLLAGVPADLIILAHASNDLAPNAMAGPMIAAGIAGHPVALSITDQGSAAPFTALELARLSLGRRGVHRVVVLVCDQQTSPFITEQAPAEMVDGDGVVGMVFERSGLGSSAIVQQRITEAGSRAALDEVFGAVARAEPLTVITGPGVDPAWVPPRGDCTVLRGPVGRPATSVWSALVDMTPGEVPGSDLPVVLLDQQAERTVSGWAVLRPQPR